MKIENVLRNKLHDELVNQGITPKYVGAIEGENPIGAIIELEEGADMKLVQQIIDAHDPTPLPQPKSQLEILQETVDMLVVESLEGMYNV